MPEKLIAAWRRADRSVFAALIFSLVFAAAAGGFVPAARVFVAPTRTVQVHRAALPLRLVPDKPVEAIINPASLVLRTPPVDVTPLLQQFVLEKMLAERKCLAEAMYYEARGEGVNGEKAIAEVVFHRMHSPRYPRSICGVVYQRAAAGHGCQFSFTCNGDLDRAKAPGSWARAKRLAGKILTGLVTLGDETENAIAFHAVDVQPGWGDRLVKTIQIGNHIFYRAAPRNIRSS
ncbi:MAG: cell wall hydrolase [Rhizomicrobium sp.]